MKTFCLLLLVLALPFSSRGDFFDFLKKKKSAEQTNGPAGGLNAFSSDQLSQALKEALAKGVSTAVTNLGQPGGFLENPEVKIPIPEKLRSVEKTLRALKQDQYADEFVATMNRAAEKAVPEALPIFTDALKAMTIDDAKKLLTGGDDSATQFFKTRGEKRIQEKMLPVVKEATEKAGVTAAYKNLLDQASGASGFFSRFKINTSSLDLDNYVAEKASDGLFKMVAEEEKRIRENPAARSTELLEKVFGVLKQ